MTWVWSAPANSRGIGGKWLELLKEVAPRATRIAVLRDSTVAAGSGQFGAVQALAPASAGKTFPRSPRSLLDTARTGLAERRGMDVAQWLQDLGLPKYAVLFR
ncbi:MAG TPA: hypothetical protein VFP38_11390, partial [Bradyrhizobium sp.]|nr:hypothetical protein [Bradyrhizobium sp.]